MPPTTTSSRSRGSWFSYQGERIGQGRENAKQFLKENRDITAKLEVEVRKELGLLAPAVPAPGPAPDYAKVEAKGAVARR